MAILIREPINALEDVARPEQASKDVKDNTVLSFSFEKDLLPRREAALRSVGYDVFSTTSEACIRFEIQMGLCGVLLLCYTIPDTIRRDVGGLFDRHCAGGVIVFVMHPGKLEESRDAEICLLDSDFPRKLRLIEDFRTSHKSARNTLYSRLTS
jgi:hypothetical protein